MPGIRVFKSLEEAFAAGFVFHERTPDGILVRRTSGDRFALAIVKNPQHDIDSAVLDDESLASER